MPNNTKYDLYVYYKGDDKKLTGKASFFGNYEKIFEQTYTGSKNDKEMAYIKYITKMVEDLTSNAFLSAVSTDTWLTKFNDILKQYFEPKYKKELYPN